jgi:hypothetical protein
MEYVPLIDWIIRFVIELTPIAIGFVIGVVIVKTFLLIK